MRSTVTGPVLSLDTCARRLGPLGVRRSEAGGGGVVLGWPDEPGPEAHVACDISWWGPARPPGASGSELLVQAASGLMHLHGRDLGGPRPIGIELASVAAGMLAAQALLAVAVGRRRGIAVSEVHTSVLQAGLLAEAHHLAAATCPPEEWPAPGPAPGPPFATSDGRWFEIETFDAEAWKRFWLRLGAPEADLGAAWTRFRPRYYRGTTSLPDGFHEATARHTLEEVTAAARACGMSLSPVRSYAEVLADPTTAGLPVVGDLVPGAGPSSLAPPPSPRTALPLAGLEVVEATSRLQGPLAGLLLQMLGAHVTRIEAPGGDVGRGVPPLADGTGSFFLCFNRGKDTVELDLESTAGRRDLVDRAASADVFLHNWRPGKAAEWALAPDDLGRVNPRLVCAEASGWTAGSGGADLIGTDFLVQAWTGLGNGLHPEPAPPRPSRLLLTDFMGALLACEGVLAGLHRRERLGRGCRVATSLEAGAMALQAHVVDALRRRGRGHGRRPPWGLLELPLATADGLLAVAAGDDDQLERLGRLCGVGPDRPRPEVELGVAAALTQGPAGGWEEKLAAVGVGCEPVVTDLAALADDPRAAPLLEGLAGSSRAPASPWRLQP